MEMSRRSEYEEIYVTRWLDTVYIQYISRLSPRNEYLNNSITIRQVYYANDLTLIFRNNILLFFICQVN